MAPQAQAAPHGAPDAPDAAHDAANATVPAAPAAAPAAAAAGAVKAGADDAQAKAAQALAAGGAIKSKEEDKWLYDWQRLTMPPPLPETNDVRNGILTALTVIDPTVGATVIIGGGIAKKTLGFAEKHFPPARWAGKLVRGGVNMAKTGIRSTLKLASYPLQLAGWVASTALKIAAIPFVLVLSTIGGILRFLGKLVSGERIGEKEKRNVLKGAVLLLWNTVLLPVRGFFGLLRIAFGPPYDSSQRGILSILGRLSAFAAAVSIGYAIYSPLAALQFLRGSFESLIGAGTVAPATGIQ